MSAPRGRPPVTEPDLQYLRRRGNRRVRKVHLIRSILRSWRPILLQVLPSALLLFLAAQGIRHVGDSRLLALERIDVDGVARTSAAAVQAGIAPLIGRNLLDLDLDEIAARARENPWVREAEVKRVFPRTLRVTVAERVPAARALVDSVVVVVDDEGAVLGTAGPEAADDLPVLTGLDGLRGEALRERMSRGARALLALETEAPSWFDEISELDVSRSDRIGVITATPGPAILLDPDAVGRNLGPFLALRAEIERRIGPLAYVDLRWRDRISVLPSEDERMESD